MIHVHCLMIELFSLDTNCCNRAASLHLVSEQEETEAMGRMKSNQRNIEGKVEMHDHVNNPLTIHEQLHSSSVHSMPLRIALYPSLICDS